LVDTFDLEVKLFFGIIVLYLLENRDYFLLKYQHVISQFEI